MLHFGNLNHAQDQGINGQTACPVLEGERIYGRHREIHAIDPNRKSWPIGFPSGPTYTVTCCSIGSSAPTWPKSAPNAALPRVGRGYFWLPSLTLRRRIAGRKFRPRTALCSQIVTHLEQIPHIGGLERLLELSGEGSGDVGKIEIHAVALRGQVDPIQVAHTVGLTRSYSRRSSRATPRG
jgi:hypothetical protein